MRAVLLLIIACGVLPAAAHDGTPDEEVRREELEARKRELREEARELREIERAHQAEQRRRASRRPPSWALNVGTNEARVDFGEENCSGAQAGLALGWPLLLRLHRTHVSYESDDDTDTCDGGFAGDSQLSESAALAGIALGRSGFYLAGGLADVDVERTAFGPWGRDTGARYEIGWSSRMRGWPVGFEIVAFRNDNDIRDFNGVGMSLVFGPGTR